ncbi:MAG TPA: hypothetical protein VMV04_06860 [Thermodesulfobacteriota bacterium]|nr:hypothetical protein [Thermodesulfobacteriota bacterium]
MPVMTIHNREQLARNIDYRNSFGGEILPNDLTVHGAKEVETKKEGAEEK